MKIGLLSFLSFLILSLKPVSAEISEEQAHKVFRAILAQHKRDLQQLNKTIRLKVVDEEKIASVYPFKKAVLLLSRALIQRPSIKASHIRNIICHEFGHILGGTPLRKQKPGFPFETSIEGQSDYFAATKCLKRLYSNPALNRKAVAKIPSKIQKIIKNRGCRTNQCIRIVYESFETLKIIYPESKLYLDKKDPRRVTYTKGSHPNAQCRLDTFLAGAVCPSNPDSELDLYELHNGTCSRNPYDTIYFPKGARPRCWFAP